MSYEVQRMLVDRAVALLGRSTGPHLEAAEVLLEVSSLLRVPHDRRLETQEGHAVRG